jgi:hypothetical protein
MFDTDTSISQEVAASIFGVEDGDSIFFQNIGTNLPNYTASNPRKP